MDLTYHRHNRNDGFLKSEVSATVINNNYHDPKSLFCLNHSKKVIFWSTRVNVVGRINHVEILRSCTLRTFLNSKVDFKSEITRSCALKYVPSTKITRS